MTQVSLSQALDIGIAHHHAGRLPEAEEVYRAILEQIPEHPTALALLGTLATDVGRLDIGIDLLRRAIAIDPSVPDFYNNLGEPYRVTGRYPQAMACYQKAITLNPNFSAAHANLALVLERMGRADDAIASHRRAIALDPSSEHAHNNLLVALNYHATLSPGEIFAEHRKWAEKFADPLTPATRPARTRHRPLRIGYVSPDFREHAVRYFIEPVLAAHDHARVHVTCYGSVPVEDAVTQRLRAYADVWHDIRAMSDDDAAALVRAQEIDVLVDLAGHMAHHRLLLFARRPAPVQVTWLGYPNTTGMRAMDYRLTDAVADPPGMTDAYYREKLVRLPGSFLCYGEPVGAPAVGEPPALSRGHVTFGSFNNFAKVSPAQLELWSRVLREMPGSRLALKSEIFGDSATGDALREKFAMMGIDAERLWLIDWSPRFEDHLALYGDVDIALDTFPYHGTTTTCEALWMGVPVVTRAGQVHAARVSASLLHSVGLDELVTSSDEEYIRAAVELARDLPKLQTLRAGLRERMRTSPLMDAKGFTCGLEETFERLCESTDE